MEFFQSPIFVFVLLGVSCYILTFIVRRVIETAFPRVKSKVISGADAVKGTELEGMPTVGGSEVFPTAISRWWNQVILYTIAPFWGVVMVCLFHGEKFYPEILRPWVITIPMGLFCGFFSGLMVKVLKKIFLDRVGATDEATLPSTSQ